MLVTTKNLNTLKPSVSQVVSRKDLKTVEDPSALPKWRKSGKPTKTYWRPINHSVLANMVVDQILGLGLKLVSETWILCMQNQMGLLADLEIATSPRMKLLDFYPKDIVDDLFFVEEGGMSMHLLFRHSNNARWALHFLPAIESNEFETGWVFGPFGSLGVLKKHSTCMGLRQYIYDCISACLCNFGLMLEKMDYLDKSLTMEQGDHLIIQAGIEQAIPWRYISEVASIWRDRTHPFFGVDGSTVRTLYNCFAEVAKKRSPRDIPDTLDGCKDVLLYHCGNGVAKVHSSRVLDETASRLAEVEKYDSVRPSEDFFDELDRTDDGDTFWEAFDASKEDS